MKRALITGITGQDGSYLAELLLSKGYEVHGIIRRSSVFTTGRIDHLIKDSRLVLHHGDMNDSSNISSLISSISPSEIYHLAAQSHVGVSFEVPEYTGDVSGLGTLRILNAIKSNNSGIRLYNASTSEMFGGLVGTVPQSELTPFHPRSPYGAAKLYAHWLAINYREAFGIYAANGILFNHESPRRGRTFVTRKITMSAASWKTGNPEILKLGNLNAVRDWGYAGDYVQAMWLMLQADVADDYVIATGHPCSVREFAHLAFSKIGMKIEWRGQGESEIGFDTESGMTVIEVDPRYYRPSEVEILVGDARKAQELLGWKAETSLDSLITMMIESDIRSLGGRIQ